MLLLTNGKESSKYLFGKGDLLEICLRLTSSSTAVDKEYCSRELATVDSSQAERIFDLSRRDKS